VFTIIVLFTGRVVRVPWFHVTAVKISVLCVISAFERSLRTIQESRAVAVKPHGTVVKFDTYRNFQWHRAVLPAI